MIGAVCFPALFSCQTMSIKMLLLIMIIILMMIMMLLRDKTFSFSCRVDKLKECFCVRVERWSDQAAPTVISDICVCTACCSFPVFPLYFFIVFLWHFFDIFVCTVVCPFVPVFLYYIYCNISTIGLSCLLVFNALICLNFY